MATFNNQATAQLLALMRRVSDPLPGLMSAGRAVRLLLQRHYRAKDASEPNKLGGERTHYWLGVAQAVNMPKQTGQAQVTVSISHPTILQKIKGGRIVAKRGQMLTIPVDPRAHGRRASALENDLGIKLFVGGKLGRAFLAARVKEGRNSVLRIFYILRRSVVQQKDPTALPPQEEINVTINEAFSAWVLRTTK